MTNDQPQVINEVMPSPGVGNAYGHGWRRLWPGFLDLLLAGIVYVAISVPVGFIVGLIFALGLSNSFSSSYDFFGWNAATAEVNWGYQAVTTVLDILVFTPLLYGLLFVALVAVRGARADLANLFTVFKTNYANVIILGVIFWIIFSLPSYILGWLGDVAPPVGIILSIIWAVFAIILFVRFMFVPFLMTDKKFGASQAMSTSWEWTRGHAMENFLIVLLGILVVIAGAIVLVVGIIPAVMWVALAVASQYEAVRQQKETHVAFPSPLVP